MYFLLFLSLSTARRGFRSFRLRLRFPTSIRRSALKHGEDTPVLFFVYFLIVIDKKSLCTENAKK